MLAQNFKTAADLGIRESEHDALIKVLGMLERDELVHVPINRGSPYFERKPRKVDALFNMSLVFARASCGTAACIAGTSDFFFKTKFSVRGDLRSDLPDSLYKLFCPDAIYPSNWEKITTEHAARALRSYLSTGEANWAEAAEALAC